MPKNPSDKNRNRAHHKQGSYSLAPPRLSPILTVLALPPLLLLAIAPILSISDPASCVAPRPLFSTGALPPQR